MVAQYQLYSFRNSLMELNFYNHTSITCPQSCPQVLRASPAFHSYFSELTGQCFFAIVVVRGAAELTCGASVASLPYPHCAKHALYRLVSLDLWTASKVSICESAPPATPSALVSSRSPLGTSKSLFC